MAGASRSEHRPTRAERLGGSWRRLGVEQRVAAVGTFLLAFSTLGPFSFVEAAQLLVCFGVLALLKARADGRRFHLPFGDGTIVMVAGLWSAGLILVRIFDRPLGQGLLALVCAAIVAGAGLRERSQRPMDDVARQPAPAGPQHPTPASAPRPPTAWPPADQARTRPPLPGPDDDLTRRLPDEPTERLPAEHDEPTEQAEPGEEPTERLEPADARTERLEPGEDPTRNLPPEPPLPR